MRVTITASIRLLFILTLVAITVVAQTGLISASPSPAGVRTTRVPKIGISRDCRMLEENLRSLRSGSALTRTMKRTPRAWRMNSALLPMGQEGTLHQVITYSDYRPVTASNGFR